MGTLGWLVTTTLPGQAAERIYVSYGALERSISVASLETYAREGQIRDEDLAVYARFAKPQELEQLRSTLVARADLSPVAVSQFLYSPQGEILLRRLGQVIQPESRQSGFNAIRAGLILASADPEGLTLLNFLRKFPTRGLRVDVARSLDIVAALEQLVTRSKQASQTVIQQAAQELTNGGAIAPGDLNLQAPGPYQVRKQALTLVDLNRNAVSAPGGTLAQRVTAPVGSGRTIPVDVYVPEGGQLRPNQPVPIIVISHGLGSDRNTFAYVAEHLTSHGFAVLVPEHPGSNAKQLEALINGTASEVAEPTEFVDRPLDVTFLLNEMQRQAATKPELNLNGRLNFQQVGVLGQSFGGYTALALAGAPISQASLLNNCRDLENTLNLSLLLQCRALQLGKDSPTLQDPRVKAVVALNPITSAVLGAESMAQIKVPTLILTGNADTIAPALLEQIRPFTWLTTPERYLVMLDRGTHFSVIGGSDQGEGVVPLPPEVIGPSPAIARRYVDALSLAFFKTYVADQPVYRPYLSAAYANTLSEGAMPLSLTQFLTAAELARK